jgi:predicted nucleic acid-binding protein
VTVILDASVAIGWIAPTQTGAASRTLRASGADFAAPWVFAVEVRNGLVRLERRRLADPVAVDAGLAAIHAEVDVKAEPTAQEFARIYTLARAERLSFFDAAYLDLAMTLGAEIATCDAALLAAAARRGVQGRDLR